MRAMVCSACAVLDHQARGHRFQVDVARADHQRVAQRGAHQAHDLALLVADRLQRQVLGAAVLLDAADGGDGLHFVERLQRLLVAREIRDEIAAVREAPGEGRRAEALVGPARELGGERVVGYEQHGAALGAHQGAAAVGTLVERQHVERGRRAPQLVHADHRHAQGRAEPVGESVRVEREALLEHVDQPAP